MVALDRRHRGDAAEYLVAAELIAAGRTVSMPHVVTKGYDLIVQHEQNPNHWHRIEVKSVGYKPGRTERSAPLYSIDLRRGIRNAGRRTKDRVYQPGEHDFLVGVLLDERKCYLFDASELEGRNAVNVKLDANDPDWSVIP